MSKVLKLISFKWNLRAWQAFEEIKKILTQALVLALPCFKKIFQVERDVYRVGIGGVLTQDGYPIAYISKKLCDFKRKYSTYNKEFYPIIRSIEHWGHYLVANEFNLHPDHKELKYIQG